MWVLEELQQMELLMKDIIDDRAIHLKTQRIQSPGTRKWSFGEKQKIQEKWEKKIRA